jgi:signal transduction histidine kinase
MNAILGWLAILESGKPIREVYSVLDVVRRNANIQAKLIDDLLDMNRLISGNMQLEIGPIDTGALLQTTIQGLKPAADAKAIQVVAAIDTNLGEIAGDSRRIQQVLWNLAHNAIKFTPNGGRVEIHIRRNAGQVEIAVQDNGCGISAAFLPHVFERFRQEAATATRTAPGLGLGLSITKHLVELHGGTIQAASPGVGGGATFLVILPARPGNQLEGRSATLGENRSPGAQAAR